MEYLDEILFECLIDEANPTWIKRSIILIIYYISRS
jgi:hypothetical protein